MELCQFWVIRGKQVLLVLTPELHYLLLDQSKPVCTSYVREEAVLVELVLDD